MLTHGVIGAVIFLAGVTIDEKTLVPLGSAIAVGLGVIWLSRWMQKIDDRLESGEERFDRLEKSIEKLPCQKDAKCKK